MSELPKGWCQAPLEELWIEKNVGIVRSAREQSENGDFPYIRMQHYNLAGEWNSKNLTYVQANQSEAQQYMLRENDILFNTRNSYELVGKVAIWPKGKQGYLFNNNLLRMRFPVDIYAKWIFYQMVAPQFQAALKTSKSATTSVCAIYQKALATKELILPPLNEQKRIVSKIESLTKLSGEIRESLEAMPPLLERLRQSVLAKAFRGDLTKDWRAKNPNVEPPSKLLERIRKERRKRWEEAELAKMKAKGKTPKNDKWKQKYKEPEPVDTEGLPDLPKGWCWTNIDQMTQNFDNIRVPVKSADRSARQGPYPYYGAFGIIDHVDNFLFDGSYLLIAEDGKNLVQRTKPIALIASGQFWVNNHAHVVQTLGDISLSYLKCYVNGFDLTLHLTGIDQVKLTRGAMNRVPVPLAPLAEQEEIVKVCNDSVLNSREQEAEVAVMAEQLKRLNQSILAKAFRGELVPQDPDDEPALVLLERIKAEREAAAANKKKSKKKAPKQKATSKGKKTQRASASSSKNASKPVAVTGGKPPPIEEMPAERIMAAFQKACSDSTWSSRELLIKEVSRILGYRRTGAKIKSVLDQYVNSVLE